MEMTAEMIQRAKEIAEELHYDYAKVGIRVQEVPFELGEMSHRSHVCVDGEETEDELDGVCAQDVKTLGRYQNQYYGNHVAIVVGNISIHIPRGGDDKHAVINLRDWAHFNPHPPWGG